MTDLMQVAYKAEVGFCILTFTVFLWWGIYQYRKKGVYVSTAYVVLALFFLGLAYSSAVSIYVRSLRPDPYAHKALLDSPMWATHVLPRLILELIWLVHIAKKIIYNFAFNSHPYRRRTDKTGMDDIGNIYNRPLSDQEMRWDLVVKQRSIPCGYRSAAVFFHREYFKLKMHLENDHDGIGSNKER